MVSINYERPTCWVISICFPFPPFTLLCHFFYSNFWSYVYNLFNSFCSCSSEGHSTLFWWSLRLLSSLRSFMTGTSCCVASPSATWLCLTSFRHLSLSVMCIVTDTFVITVETSEDSLIPSIFCWVVLFLSRWPSNFFLYSKFKLIMSSWLGVWVKPWTRDDSQCRFIVLLINPNNLECGHTFCFILRVLYFKDTSYLCVVSSVPLRALGVSLITSVFFINIFYYLISPHCCLFAFSNTRSVFQSWWCITISEMILFGHPSVL